MAIGELLADYVSAIGLINIGSIELYRVWRYQAYGERSIHYVYRIRLSILRARGDLKEADEYERDLTENWWQHHGWYSIFQGLGLPMGIILLYMAGA